MHTHLTHNEWICESVAVGVAEATHTYDSGGQTPHNIFPQFTESGSTVCMQSTQKKRTIEAPSQLHYLLVSALKARGFKEGTGPSNFWINEHKRFFNKHKVKVYVSSSWRCPGTSKPRAPHLTMCSFLCCSGRTQKVEGPSGHQVSSKSTSMVRDR